MIGLARLGRWQITADRCDACCVNIKSSSMSMVANECICDRNSDTRRETRVAKNDVAQFDQRKKMTLETCNTSLHTSLLLLTSHIYSYLLRSRGYEIQSSESLLSIHVIEVVAWFLK